MVARYRLWRQLKDELLLAGLLLLVTVGFPWVARLAGRDPGEVPALARLEQVGRVAAWAIPLLLVALGLWALYRPWQRQRAIHRRLAGQGVTYLILPRPDAPAVRGDRVHLWQRVAEALPPHEHLSFEVARQRERISFSLRAASDGVAREVLAKVRAEWPGTEMRRVTAPAADPQVPEAGRAVHWIEIRPANREQPVVPATTDSMKSLLTEIALLPEEVAAGLQVLVRRDPYTAYEMHRKAARLTPRRVESGPYAYQPSAEESEVVENIHQRAAATFLEARVLLWVAADTPRDAAALARALAEGVLAQVEPGGLLSGNRLRTGASGRGTCAARTFPAFAGHPWTARELGSLAHLVGGDAREAAPQLCMAPARVLPASPPTHLYTGDVVAELAPLAGNRPGTAPREGGA